MEEALVARLLATVAITAIAGTRINWQDAGGVPGVTLTVAADPRSYNHDGAENLQEARIQFDCRGRNYSEAKLLSRAVLSEMETTQEQGSIRFEEGRKVSGSDAPKETAAGGTGVFKVTMDIMVLFSTI